MPIQKLRSNGSKPSTSPNVWVTPNRPVTAGEEKLKIRRRRDPASVHRIERGGLDSRLGGWRRHLAPPARPDMFLKRLGPLERDA